MVKFCHNIVDTNVIRSGLSHKFYGKTMLREKSKILKKVLGVRCLLQVPLDRDYLKLESYICLHVANGVHCLYDKAPNIYISRETADTSQFCEVAWYD